MRTLQLGASAHRGWGIMRKVCLIGLALAAPGGLVAVGTAQAADPSTKPDFGALASTSVPKGKKAPVNCRAPDAPYKDYSCLDTYLGDGFFERLINYYRLEWGHEGPPADPKAPPARRAGWPDAPQTTPPYPFTEWPYGGSTSIGVTRAGSIDSPLMVALANTTLGKWMNDSSIQVYGWVNGGGNLSTNTVKFGGNAPAAYSFNPNSIQLDQAVVYIERLPDTVQQDHIDWGFRFSAIYGENYRYTTSYGVASYQLLGHNLYNGFDFPMVYGELYIPQIADGLLLRLGRYISVPDIEAQLAPNNYMYSHSMTYTFDNYTNEGLQATLALNKNWFVQLGTSIGTEAAPWQLGKTVANPFPNPMYPNNTMLRDPGAIPSITAGIRWQSDSGKDNIYVVADAINSGIWGYNNLQWTGITWYHTINEQWHFSWETYTLSQKNVINVSGGNATANAILANGGFPFTLQNGFNFNAPFGAICGDAAAISCTARSFASLIYVNYKFAPMDNLSFRAEFFNDMEGQRTGTKTRYTEFGVGWQHWFSPQVEIRPEVSYYRSLDANAFNGNFNNVPASAGGLPIVTPNRNYALIAAMDLIWHF
jgi:hypothetical protein